MPESETATNHPTANDPALQERLKRETIASLSDVPFMPPAWLRNAHAQTIWSRYGHRILPPALRLERWDTPDDDFLRVHFLDVFPERPAALLFHGLEGSVESTYLVRLIHALHAAQFNVIVMEHRSCGGEMNRARRMYHSGETTDADFVIREFGRRFPDKTLYLAGYSLGGNVVAKWLGEQGADVPAYVQAAAVVSAPYDLLGSGPYVDSGIRRLLYVKHFLRKLIPKAIEKERQYPGCIDIECVKRSTTFREFDTYATAALHGFADAEDYYAKAACGQFLDRVRRPTLLLSAADDPFNPNWTFPQKLAEESPYLHAQFTELGGHVGFVNRNNGRGLAYWAEDQIVRFFQTYARLFAE